MKVPTVEQIRTLDAQTIEKEPITSSALMERAATACFNWIEHKVPREKPFAVFCGSGNNGGDGLVIARLLAQKKRVVSVFLVGPGMDGSPDFLLNLGRLRKNPTIEIRDLRESTDLPAIADESIVIDAIFGTGLTKPVRGRSAEIITHLNHSKAFQKISIDIPSGLFAEDNTHNDGSVFEAGYTLTFQFPKLAFFFAENHRYTGTWHVLPIGLHAASIAATSTTTFYTDSADIHSIVQVRSPFAHKGNFGHALLLAGSNGKIGAAVLASRATLRAGAGLLTTHTPGCGYSILQTAVPEAMVSSDPNGEHISELPPLGAYQAIAIGPGIGRDEDTARCLKVLIQEIAIPVIYDADALNLLAENKTWLAFLSAGSILTPHPGEFDRLAGKSANGCERLQKQKELSLKHGIYIILKGAYTSVSCPDGHVFINSTGNPGMATAGSGDVLTGILLGLRAQGYSPLHTCILGVYLHGMAGDIGAAKRSQHALIAGDLIDFTGLAWKRCCP